MTIIAELVHAGIGFLAESATVALRNSPKLPETPPPSETTECVACTAHLELGLAYVYLKGLAARCQPDQPVPAGLGGTLNQARQHVGNTIAQIPEIMSITPETARVGTELANSLPNIEQRLSNVKNGAEVIALRDDLERALDTAYKIPEAVYRRDDQIVISKSELEALQQGMRILRQQIKRLEETHAVGD